MKQLLFSAAIIASLAGNAQTRLIAYKSHSGYSADYTTESFGNFGMIELPRTVLRTVEKVNDTTVVLTSSTFGGEQKDTVHHHPHFNNPEISGDSLRKMYNNEVEFRNFEPQKAAPKKDPATPKRVEQQRVPAKQPQPSGRKNNSLWLLIIGGGTFLGTGLVATGMRRRKTAARYA